MTTPHKEQIIALCGVDFTFYTLFSIEGNITIRISYYISYSTLVPHSLQKISSSSISF